MPKPDAKERARIKVVNAERRAKNLSREEWRVLYDETFNKTATDLFKNIRKWNYHIDENDIKQQLELSFCEFYEKFISGKDIYEFPPLQEVLYKWNEKGLFHVLAPPAGFGGTTLELQINDNPEDDEGDPQIGLPSIDFWKELEKREEEWIYFNICEAVGIVVGVELDDVWGPEFALWWLGYSRDEIGAFLKVARALTGMPQKNISPALVAIHLRKAFKLIEEKTELSRKDLRYLRKVCRKEGFGDSD